MRSHLDVSVGKSVEQKICCQFFVFVTGEIGLGDLYFGETQLHESIDGLLVRLGNQDSPRRGLLLSLTPRNLRHHFSSFLFIIITLDDSLELFRVLRDQTVKLRGALRYLLENGLKSSGI